MQWCREPFRFSQIRTRSPNLTDTVEIQTVDLVVVRLLLARRPSPALLPKELAQDREICSARRSAQKTCSGNSLAEAWEEAHSEDHLVVSHAEQIVAGGEDDADSELGLGGQGFVFNMGPGIRVQQMGGGMPRARPHNHANANTPMTTSGLLQGLFPLILFVLLTIFTSLLAGTKTTYPTFSWQPQPAYSLERLSGGLKVPYYVDPATVRDYTDKNWQAFDRYADQLHVEQVEVKCRWELNQQQRLFQGAQGLFWGYDEEKWRMAKEYRMENCEKLQKWRLPLPR